MIHHGRDWNLRESKGIEPWTWDQIQAHLLLDIRYELRSLNDLLHCQNFQDIPHLLRTIRGYTSRLRRAKKPTKRAKARS